MERERGKAGGKEGGKMRWRDEGCMSRYCVDIAVIMSTSGNISLRMPISELYSIRFRSWNWVSWQGSVWMNFGSSIWYCMHDGVGMRGECMEIYRKYDNAKLAGIRNIAIQRGFVWKVSYMIMCKAEGHGTTGTTMAMLVIKPWHTPFLYSGGALSKA